MCSWWLLFNGNIRGVLVSWGIPSRQYGCFNAKMVWLGCFRATLMTWETSICEQRVPRKMMFKVASTEKIYGAGAQLVRLKVPRLSVGQLSWELMKQGSIPPQLLQFHRVHLRLLLIGWPPMFKWTWKWCVAVHHFRHGCRFWPGVAGRSCPCGYIPPTKSTNKLYDIMRA